MNVSKCGDIAERIIKAYNQRQLEIFGMTLSQDEEDTLWFIITKELRAE